MAAVSAQNPKPQTLAAQDCEKAVERDPREFAAWFNRGNVEARLLDYAQALSSYRKAADLAPGIIGALRACEALLARCFGCKGVQCLRIANRAYMGISNEFGGILRCPTRVQDSHVIVAIGTALGISLIMWQCIR